MTSMPWPTLTGVAAALCTTLAFVPQLFKMHEAAAAPSCRPPCSPCIWPGRVYGSPMA